MKKTFAKKRNQRRAIYVGSAVIIVSLLFGIFAVQAKASQDKHELYQKVQQVRTDKQNKIKELSNDLQQIKQAKAVTDTQLQEKAASEAQKQSEIDKLKADLQAKADAEATLAVAPTPSVSMRTGGVGGGDSSGNLYTYGYCTWYVKNRRPDIPNNWGDAYQWTYNAQSIGWPTGFNPRPGAIGNAGNHVVYVEQVNGDGTILISEMNYVGWNTQSSRTVSASAFTYIY